MNWFRVVLVILSLVGVKMLQADVTTHFTQLKTNPELLYAFLKKMPKGGELHYHLAGGSSPETMLLLIADDTYCIKKETFVSEKYLPPTLCNEIKSNTLQKNSAVYTKIVGSWSMAGFAKGKESAHDHFFNTFMKFMPIVVNYRAQLLADVLQRAALQNEHYLEIMDIPDNAEAIRFGELIKNAASFSERKELLLDNKEFQENVQRTLDEAKQMLAQAYKELGCEQNTKKKACQVKARVLYYVLREQPLDGFFAQALNAFEAVSRAQGILVGVNLVQPEDGVISLRDYRQQMRIVNYLHQQYPQVPIALHAGELAPGLVPNEELKYHIHDAVFIGKAQRIGHGVDIRYETEAKKTLAYMAKQHIPVEINLTSNSTILNVSAAKHPLNYYLKHQVPVVLSTDDEGILRTDLTQQYLLAATEHHLDYPTLKQINRNTLTFAFLPGASIWANSTKGERVTVCANLDAPKCKAFIAQNEKAQLQWELEKALIAFEKKY